MDPTNSEHIRYMRDGARSSRNLTACLTLCLLGASVAGSWQGNPFAAAVLLKVALLASCACGSWHYVCSAPTRKSMLKRHTGIGKWLTPVALSAWCVILAQADFSAVSDESHILLRSLFTFLPPIVLTRECPIMSTSKGIQPWCISASTHILATATCFGGFEWIIPLVFIDLHLLDMACTKLHADRAGLENAQREKHSTISAFASLCDAVVTLDAQWRIVGSEGLKRLAAMLGRHPRTMAGCHFTDFVYCDDYQYMSAHMREIVQAGSYDGDRYKEERKVPTSIAVRLADAYATPVTVHMFHIRHRFPNEEVRVSLGICGAWHPEQKSVQQRGQPQQGRQTQRSGQVRPSETGQMAHGGKVRSSRAGFLLPLETPSMSCSPRSRMQQQRRDSPRPEARLGLRSSPSIDLARSTSPSGANFRHAPGLRAPCDPS